MDARDGMSVRQSPRILPHLIPATIELKADPSPPATPNCRRPQCTPFFSQRPPSTRRGWRRYRFVTGLKSITPFVSLLELPIDVASVLDRQPQVLVKQTSPIHGGDLSIRNGTWGIGLANIDALNRLEFTGLKWGEWRWSGTIGCRYNEV